MGFYERHYGRERRREGCRPRASRPRRTPWAEGGAPTLDSVLHRENLMAAFREVRSRPEAAPGPDGLRSRDLSPAVFGELAGALPDVVRSGNYRPAPARRVAIPKAAGGTRTIAVQNLFDRVVAPALVRGLTPTWESVFLPISYGFRPRRGAWLLLADLMRRMVAEGRHVLAQDDVRGAFDAVALGDVLDDHRRYIGDMELVRLVELVLLGGRVGRPVGIPQGNPYSPSALNLRLHHAHDRPLAADRGAPPAYRYADDLAYLCASVSEGRRVLARVRRRLGEAGLAPKGADGPPRDLRRGEVTQVLGFSLSLDGREPRLGVGAHAWRHLDEALARAHGAADPPGAAASAVLGWIDAQGPALEGYREGSFLDGIVRRAARSGSRERIVREELEGRADRAFARWCAIRDRPGADAAGRRGDAGSGSRHSGLDV